MKQQGKSKVPARMSERDKRRRAEIKKQLQAEGVIPPDKPRLNRKAFCEEAKAELDELCTYESQLYLLWALNEMLGHRDREIRVDNEAIGAAKVIKLALRRRKFEEELEQQLRREYTVGEIYEAVKDIYNA